jgi:predicted dehydrogenase
MREILDDPEIDVVSSATPNHWHALLGIWACQAGKDIYLEKPVSHEIWEGRKLVEAARKYNRIVQTGSQNRSDIGLREVMPFIADGNLGKVQWSRGLCYKQRNNRDGTIYATPSPMPIPENLDYNRWCGPAEMEPLYRERVHYLWHWMWNSGNGDIGNQGVHEMDVARWALGQEGLPRRVMTISGRLGVNDDADTFNTQIVCFDYEPAPLIFEVRGLPASKGVRQMDRFMGSSIGNIVKCENGYFSGGRGGGWTYDNDGNRLQQFPGDSGGGHAQNFIDAVRSRKPGDLHAEVLVGHVSAALCHMANISGRVGRKATPDEIRAAIGDNAEFMDSFDRLLAHLKANEVDLEAEPLTLGQTLTIDPQTERFVGEGSEWANMFIKRNYREPFVVPDEV